MAAGDAVPEHLAVELSAGAAAAKEATGSAALATVLERSRRRAPGARACRAPLPSMHAALLSHGRPRPLHAACCFAGRACCSSRRAPCLLPTLGWPPPPPRIATCRLCLQQYEKERFSPTAFMELFSKLNATLTDEQLSVFAGALLGTQISLALLGGGRQGGPARPPRAARLAPLCGAPLQRSLRQVTAAAPSKQRRRSHRQRHQALRMR